MFGALTREEGNYFNNNKGKAVCSLSQLVWKCAFVSYLSFAALSLSSERKNLVRKSFCSLLFFD